MLRPVGAGVIGEVYEAREKAGGRRVAVKRIFSDISQNVQFATIFFKTLEKLLGIQDHPPLTTILDLYYDEEDALCIVMEFVEGTSLDRYIKLHGTLPEYHALELILRIAENLQLACSERLPFHGLLNPSNIILLDSTETTEHRPVKFLDYGTAAAANDYHKTRGQAAKRKATVALFSVGDPQYLSPEQCRESGEVNLQADVYTVGLLLYHMLAGRPPFPGDELIKVMSMQMEATPPSLYDVNKRISKFSQDLVNEALRKEPLQRPTLSHFIECLKKQTASAQSSYAGYQIDKFLRGERYASIFSARHTHSQQPAIVKLVDPERTTGPFRMLAARFLAAVEAQTAEGLSEFTSIVGSGQLSSQQVYAVLQQPDGVSLADVIAGRQAYDNQVWQDRSLLVGKRLAEILSQIHAHKVLYLGLRPGNVQIVEDEHAPDGLAIRLLDSETVRPFHQAEHTLRGSDLPEGLSLELGYYVAPEQVRGAAHTPADVYALGVILYEMLGGQRPVVAASLEDLFATHQQALPRSLRDLNRTVSPALADLIHSMLDKLPARRPAMSQVAKELSLLAESVQTQKLSKLSLEELQHFLPSRRPITETLEPVSRDREPPTPEARPGPSPASVGSSLGPIQAVAAELAHEEQQKANRARERSERAPSSRPPDGEGAPPRAFGSYEVVRRLGEGGMGWVYEAINPQTRERVAIKQPRPELMIFPAFAERFINEWRFAKRIRHPGVVQVLSFDRTADGHPFIVMELIEGETLKSRIDKSRLPLARTIEIAYQIADTLQAAHHVGVIHRDLKTENVMLVGDPRTPGHELVKILDFGIAKLVAEYQATLLRRPHQTMPGAVLGTPQYMAPEQRQDSSKVTDRADVYSLGVLLYEMLSGRPPLTVEEAAAMIHTSLYIPAPPLQQRASGLPERLVALVHSMLLEDSTKRPSITVVCEELKKLARPEGASTIRENSQTLPRRGKWRMPLAITVTVLLAGLSVGYRWYRLHTIEQQLRLTAEALQRRSWGEAIAECHALLARWSLPEESKERTQSYLAMAQREKQAAELYQKFVNAWDPAEAHQLYLAVPATSVYKDDMQGRHLEMARKLTQTFLSAASEARQAGRCQEWRSLLGKTRELLPQASGLQAEQNEPCPRPQPAAPTGPTAPVVSLPTKQPEQPKPALTRSTNSLSPAELLLRGSEVAYEQKRYREAIRLVQKALPSLDPSTAIKAWRILGSAGCQAGDDDSIQAATEILSAGRAEDDFKRLQAVCKGKGYHWNGYGFILTKPRGTGNPTH